MFNVKNLATALVFALPLTACELAPESQAPFSDPGSPAGKADSPSGGAQDFALQCWDGTFAYNVVTALGGESSIEVIIEGAQLDVVELHENDGWRPGTATMEFATEECEISADGTLFSCEALDLPVTVTRLLEDETEVQGVIPHVTVELSHQVRTTASGVQENFALDLWTKRDGLNGRHTVFTFFAQTGLFPQLGCGYDESQFSF